MSSAFRSFFLQTSSGSGSSDTNRRHNAPNSHRENHRRSGHHVAEESSNALDRGAHSTARATPYPEALPSVFEKRYDGPVIGIAVIDEETMSLSEATTIFEMVTPASTPLLMTRVKERFEAAAERESAHRRTREAQAPQGRPDWETDASPSEDSANTQDYFSNPSSSPGVGESSAKHHRRRVLNKGDFFIFSDRYLNAYPSSCITGLTNELHMAAPEGRITSHRDSSEADAETQRLREVKGYIKEVEHEYRPLFRRRRSDVIYGCAQYLEGSEAEGPQDKTSVASPSTSTIHSTPKS